MTFHVTACSNCETHWIVEHLNLQETCTCPACGTTRSTDRHVSLATADDADTAAELRAQLLADDAGHLDEYKATGTYNDHGNETSDIPIGTDALEAQVNDRLTEHRDRYSEFVNLKPASASLFETEAERVAGTVGKHEHIEQYYGDQDDASDVGLPEDPLYPSTINRLTNTDSNDGSGDGGGDDPLPVNSDAGLTVTQQAPVNAVTEIRGDQPITDVWQALLKNPDIQETLIQAVRELGRGATYTELHHLLDHIGLTDTPTTTSYRDFIYSICKGYNDDWERFSELRQLGTGHTTTDDIHAAANLFRYTARIDDHTLTITVTLNHNTIRNMQRDQRVDVLQLLSTLSHGLNIRIVTGRVTEAWLRDQHRDDLAAVNDWTTTHQDGVSIDAALTTLNPDGLPVTVLRLIHNEPGSTVTYNQLYASAQHSKSRVRQVISELSDLGLVDTYQSGTGKKVETRSAARTVISELDAVHGQQTTLPTDVSEPPNSQIQRRVPAFAAPGEEISKGNNSFNSNSAADRTATADSTAEPPVEESSQDPYRTVYMQRRQHAAIAGAAGGDGRVSVLDTAHDTGLDRRVQKVSVLPDEREVAVSIVASSPISYTVGNAIALTSPLVIEAALTDDKIGDLVEEVPVAVLRLARQIGGINADSVSDPESFREVFMEWGTNIADRSRALFHGEYGECQSRDEFLSELLQDAHGLYGSIVHVLDAAGYDVLRDVHVPETVGDTDRLRDIAESIAHSVAIQSKYESFAAYRQLFEERAEKRELAFTAQVDASDPIGEMIGGMVIRGGSGHRLLEPLQQEFETFDVHQDAPEFYVPITVQDGVERSDVAVTVSRILGWKGFRVTEECISMVYGVMQSPFGAARAVNRLASPDGETSRAVSVRDIRYAIKSVGTEWLLPRLPRSAGRILHAVLELSTERSDGAVTVAGIADAADVSQQTVRNYRDVLVATGVINVCPDGWWCVFGEMESTGSDVGHNGESSISGQVEEACRDGVGGEISVWVRVAEALLRPNLSDPPDQSRKSGSNHPSKDSRRMVIKLGPRVQQESVENWNRYPDDRSDRPSGGDSSGEEYRSEASETSSDEEIDLDFSGVSIEGSIV